MKRYNYIEYKTKTVIKPVWLSILLVTLIDAVRFIIIYFVVGIILNIIFYNSILFELDSDDIVASAICFIAASFFVLIRWCKSFVRIYDDGILEVNNFSLLKKKKKDLKSYLKLDINSIKEVNIVYLKGVSVYFKKLCLKIITDNSYYCIDVDEHNEFIKELLKHNPNIKTPELPII